MQPCSKRGYAILICCLYVADGRQRDSLSAKAYIRQFTLWMRKSYNGKVFWNRWLPWRSWSSEGMEYMVWVLTARKNKTLTQALLYHANGKSYKKMDRAMHKAAVQAERKIAQNVRSEA